MRPILIFFLLLTCFSLFAQVPGTMSYQGLLTDQDGAPVPDATHSILLKFYSDETGGTAAFSRGPIDVVTFKGLFTIIIGNGQGTNNSPLPATLGNTQYWIGITPDGGIELAPRAALTSVPYAFRARYADSGVPSGSIMAYGGPTIPDGWLKCDGSAVNRADYPDLFAAVGLVWGGGDGTTTFNIPDLRGIFLRGVDDASGNDPDAASRTGKFTLGNTGDNVGSYQGDAFQGHIHFTGVGPILGSGQINGGNAGGSPIFSSYYGTSGPQEGTSGTPRFSFETRPKNAMVFYIIKY